RRLTDSSIDLATQLRTWLDVNPGAPLAIDAHSMGGRVVLAALDQLAREGRLGARAISLNLIAPPLGGYTAANAARWAPSFLGGAFDGLRPGIDMGTSSSFQERLEALALPPNVHTTIWVAERDTIVDPSMAGFAQIRARLGAETRVVPGATHDSIIDAFAARD
ncbi:hypothetical protein L6R52_43900, partial [Myxococcota bacterium]|nr:hypothetical protein [Myxococcota bacterium]